MTPTQCLFDLYHGDHLASPTYAGDVALFAQAKAAGQVALLHKLTEGAHFVDTKAIGRLGAAVRAGLLVGGYHFLTPDSVAAQLANFMHQVGLARAASGMTPFMLMIDNEPDPDGTGEIRGTIESDRLANAFVDALRHVVGKRPLFYTPKAGVYSAATARGLTACPLMLPEYGINPVCPPGWGNWTWWQRTDGKAGPWATDVPGIGPCDQSAFAGKRPEAISWWQAHGI